MGNDDFFDHLKQHPNATRLFFEFLGLHAHNLVSVTGFYGSVYLAGGVIDHLIQNKLSDWDAFETYFRPNMLPTVTARLESTSVEYVLHDELPLLGLTTL
jgi:glucokinase